jgi:hypothetical protein
MENKKKKGVLSGGWHQWEGTDIKKGCRSVNVVQVLCTCISGNMRPVENVPGMGGGLIKENDGGVNSTMIHCKNFCKCHNVPPVQQ